MADLAFFIGKGGVGKSSISAAYAVHLAGNSSAGSTLLLSTDPAHSLSDVLSVRVSDRITRLPLRRGKLFAWQVDAEKQFRRFLEKYEDELLDVIESGSIFARNDVKPLLDSALPGLAEISGLLAMEEAVRSNRYRHIIVDTAPIGHTLRLFSLPQQFSRLLRFFEIAASRDQILAEHFAGIHREGAAFLRDWRLMAERIGQALAQAAKLFLVTTPERFALNESLRCTAALEKGSPPLRIAAVVLNRATQRDSCPRCRRAHAASRDARRLLLRRFRGQPLYVAADQGSPILGLKDLGAFGAHIFAGKPLKLPRAAPRAAEVRFRPAPWPALQPPLTLVLGKGGVGKTTISAALAYRARAQKRGPVTICSVDPAPSLRDIFGVEIGDQPRAVLADPQLRASEMDSATAFAQWIQRLREQIDNAFTTERSGVHLDVSFERQLFSSLLDIVPPGVDEVFAVFRIMDLLKPGAPRVVIDMAPTGHALELLSLPDRMVHWSRLLLKSLAVHRKLALARDLAVDIAEFGRRARELGAWLRSSRRARLYTVMLPEALPDRETERLSSSLRGLKLPVAALFVNRVLFAEDIGRCGRCRRARQWQLVTLGKLKRERGRRTIYVVRNFPGEIAGKSGLRSFTSELWRLA